MTTSEPDAVTSPEPVEEGGADVPAPPADAEPSAAEHAHAHGPGEHEEHVFSQLDTSYLRSVGLGYLGGVVAIFVFMLITINYAASDLDLGVKIGVAIGVAFWIGIMGGVVAVGMWARKNEEQLHH